MTTLGPDPKPVIATNRPGELVFEAINARLGHLRGLWNQPPEVVISTAYFNAGGYSLVADELDGLQKVRLLLGAEPEEDDGRVRSLKEPASARRAERERLAKALGETEDWIREQRNLLGFTSEADALARRLVAWLRSGNVEVKRLTTRFLHGKTFTIPTGQDMALVGSSNFTYAGLAKNAELNLARYDEAVGYVCDWFEEMWGEAEPYDLASLYEDRFIAHDPWSIYLRMLLSVYGADLADEKEQQRAELRLAPFQTAGVIRVLRYLEQHNGVILADDVGLGKTYMAGEVLMRYVRDQRKRAVVIAPAVLRDGPWRRFLLDQALNVEVLSYEQLAREEALHSPDERYSLQSYLRYGLDEYSLIVVDEGHNVRNPFAQRSEALRRLLRGVPRKKLMLLTATPVNNSLMDVYELLRFFLWEDSAFSAIGIPSIKARFDEAMRKDPEDLTADDLFEILDAVVVRRTRSFVRKYHPNDQLFINGEYQTIKFPTPRPLKVDYDLEESYPGLLARFKTAIEGYEFGRPVDPGVLAMARYQPSMYKLENIQRLTANAQEIQLGGLLRSNLLKRFESSAIAFARTARKMASSHDGMLEILSNGKVPVGRALTEWMATDSDDFDDFEGAVAESDHADLEDASLYDVDWLKRDIQQDRDLLLEFAAAAEAVGATADPKLAVLVEELAQIADEAERTSVGEDQSRDRRKVLIFSYFADTVEWIANHLKAACESDPRLAVYAGRVASVSGNDNHSENVMFGFAPKTTDPPAGRTDDLYDIVVTTDVLAEGVNLQQARHEINYDLPWNPMRLTQRHGRIDRIGSEHDEVFLRCVYPDRQLNELLQLEERLQRKLKQAMTTFGGDAPLPGFESDDSVGSYADNMKDQIDAVLNPDGSFFTEMSAGGTVLGEEFRQLLRKALEHPGTRERLERLPWGVGSGFVKAGKQPGWVFCAQVGDHPEPRFAYVTMGPDGFAVDGNQLRALVEARPPQDHETPRHLTDDMFEATFGAWETAKEAIYESWYEAVDPKRPDIPAVLDRAVLVLNEHYQGVLTFEEHDDLVERFRAPYGERLLRPIREILKTGTPKEQVKALAEAADRLGFEKSPAPTPLPVANPEDIHLLCWVAITPEES